MESFARDVARSYGEPGSDNVLLHCENLDAMKRLARSGFASRFRCIYFDPPFNSGRRFAEYDDALEPTAWRAMMLERLVAARDLLADSGAIFVEIDDTELGSLQGAMDEVFDRPKRGNGAQGNQPRAGQRCRLSARLCEGPADLALQSGPPRARALRPRLLDMVVQPRRRCRQLALRVARVVGALASGTRALEERGRAPRARAPRARCALRPTALRRRQR